MHQDAPEAIRQIQEYKRRISEMDVMVNRFLLDPERYPYPEYKRLAEEIRRFETRFYQHPNRDLRFWMEGLLHSLLVNERIWNQRMEDRYQESQRPALSQDALHRLHAAIETHRTAQGLPKGPAFPLFAADINRKYQSLQPALKDDETIGFRFHRETGNVRIVVEPAVKEPTV